LGLAWWPGSTRPEAAAAEDWFEIGYLTPHAA